MSRARTAWTVSVERTEAVPMRLLGSEILLQEILDEVELGFEHPVIGFHHGRAEHEQRKAEISRTRLGTCGTGCALNGKARVREHLAERIT